MEAKELLAAFEAFIRQLQPLAAPQGDSTELVERLTSELQALQDLSSALVGKSTQPKVRNELHQILAGPLNRILPAYLLLHRLGDLDPGDGSPARTAAWLDDFLLREPLGRLLSYDNQLLLIALIRWQDPLPEENPLPTLLADEAVRACLKVHDYDGHQWLCGEALTELALGLFATAAISAACVETGTSLDLSLEQLWLQGQMLIVAGEQAGYRLDRLQTSR